MVIFNLNDPATLENTRPPIFFRIFKGSSKTIYEKKNGDKYNSIGKDLETFYRFESNSEEIRRIIYDNYTNETEQREYRAKIKEIEKTLRNNGRIPIEENSIFLSHINIFLAYKEIDKVFDTYMGLYRGQNLQFKCDRQRIYLEKTDYVTPIGHKGSKFVNCDRPCQWEEGEVSCAAGCTRNGILRFYIQELIDRDINEIGSLVVHGSTDIKLITKYLTDQARKRGNIKDAVGSFLTHHLVPYILSRSPAPINKPLTESKPQEIKGKKVYLRTGKSMRGETNICRLQINPAYLEWEQGEETISRLRLAGHAPNQKYLAAHYAMEVEARVIEQIPESTTNYLSEAKTIEQEPEIDDVRSRDEIDNFKRIMLSHGWKVEHLLALIKDKLDLDTLDEINLLDYNTFMNLQGILSNPDIKAVYQNYQEEEF